MEHLASRFLTAAEQEDVRRAVKEAEAGTSAEIVPLVVSASHDYPKAETLGAMTLALVLGALLTAAFGGSDMWVFLVLFAILFFAGHELFKRFPGLKRPFISPERLRDEVREGALLAFYRHGLSATRDHTGVLIYISAYERKVWILADKAVMDVIPQSALDGLASELSAGIRQGRQGRAIAVCVRKCALLLAPHFAVKADDADELANLIIED